MVKTFGNMLMKLETERLILRDFVKEDWEAVLAYQSDPLYLRYNHWAERTPEAVQEFVGWFLNQQLQEPRIKFHLAVVLKSNNQLIGNCGVGMDTFKTVEAALDYELDPKHWNYGYATEAAHAMVDFGFARTDITKTGSGIVYTMPFSPMNGRRIKMDSIITGLWNKNKEQELWINLPM